MRLAITMLAGLLAIPALADGLLTTQFDSGKQNRLGLVFAPDGRVAWWVAWDGPWGGEATSRKTIYTAELQGDNWSEPRPAPFSAGFNDDDPFASPDGRWIYFVSDRPASPGGMAADTNIWRYSLHAGGAPERLSVNSDAEEYSPAITGAGTLYFASARDAPGSYGQGDIYVAAASASGFAAPAALGPAINSATGEWNVWVSNDDSDMLFEASSRASNVSVSGDLYYSRRSDAGWTPAIPVLELNGAGSDLMPRLHPDGARLFFTVAAMGGSAALRSANWLELRDRLRAGFAPLLLVANRSSHEITVVDPGSATVTRRIPTGEGPHLLSNVSDGRLLASGYGEFPRPHDGPVQQRPQFDTRINSRLTLVDIETGGILRDAVLDNCERPHASWIVADRGFITCEDERKVLEVALDSLQTVGTFDTRQSGSHVLAYEPQSRTLAVSNTDDGSVTLISLDSRTSRVVALGPGSEGSIALGGRLWVANAIEGSVSVIDPQAASVAGSIDKVCSFPIAFSAADNGTVWVACFGSSEIVALDAADLAITRRISLDVQPLNITLHPSRPLAYLSVPRRNAILEVDLEAGLPTRELPAGIEPDGLRWSASGLSAGPHVRQ